MIVSMTGFGKSEAVLTGKKLSLEIKSLNSRQTDISLRMPSFLREKEPEIRNLLSRHLERGKIDLFITTELTGDVTATTINKPLALHYYRELRDLVTETMDPSSHDLLPIVMRMPDVIQSSREEASESEWTDVLDALEKAVSQVREFRIHEGTILEKDIRSRILMILQKPDSIGPYEKGREEAIRERLLADLRKIAEGEPGGAIPDRNRFEHELIYYLERLDITEEKVRLKKHCDYFLEILDEPASQGRKMGFITQEIGREINTIGSKAGDAAIQRIVVEMKDELEKIKEQLLNIL